MLIKKKQTSKLSIKPKKKSMWLINLRSRHPSHSGLKRKLQRMPFRSIVRLGSTTVIGDEVSLGGVRIECNTKDSIMTSASKLLMKQAFTKAGINTAAWFKYVDGLFWNRSGGAQKGLKSSDLEYPVVAKHIYGSRGRGNTLIKTAKEMDAYLNSRNTVDYIFEKFYNYTREYRLHITEEGCIYTCRKVLKQDTPADKKWFRNDSNSTWLVEENPKFDKPVNWDTIVNQCISALKAVGADILAFDVKIQSAKTESGKVRENPEFIIIECNSAPSMGEITELKYLDAIPKILTRKYNQFKNK